MPQLDRSAAGGRSLLLLILGVVAAAVAASLVLVGRHYDRDRSAIGFDGLVAWLSANGVEARSFNGGDRLTRERVGLRIYPLFEAGLTFSWRGFGTTPAQSGLFDDDKVDPGVIVVKLATLPTLIVLPKWRFEVIDRGVVHPKLLIAENELARLLAAVAPEAGAPLPRRDGFGPIGTTSGEARLYEGQLVRAGRCEPLIGTADAMLLGRCNRGNQTYWLLADPDLLDNHGLTQGANARIAAGVLPNLADGRPVIVDLTASTIWDTAPKEERRRSWSELLRFFAPPFTAAWAAFLLILVLTLWRAWIRMGPIDRTGDEEARSDEGATGTRTSGFRAAREVSIDARARLLRLSGHDARLVRVYTADRLQALAEALFGRRRIGGDAFDEVSRLLSRRAPAMAAEFRHAFQRDGDRVPNESELLRRVAELTTLSERIRDEFGRTARHR